MVLGKIELTDQYLVLVDLFDPAQRDQVVFEAAGKVQLGQFDLGPDDVVDAADVFAVRADDFHVFGDLGRVHHLKAFLCLG